MTGLDQGVLRRPTAPEIERESRYGPQERVLILGTLSQDHVDAQGETACALTPAFPHATLAQYGLYAALGF